MPQSRENKNITAEGSMGRERWKMLKVWHIKGADVENSGVWEYESKWS